MQGAALEPLPVPGLCGYWEVLSSHMCRRRSTRLWFTCVVATVRKEREQVKLASRHGSLFTPFPGVFNTAARLLQPSFSTFWFDET